MQVHRKILLIVIVVVLVFLSLCNVNCCCFIFQYNNTIRDIKKIKKKNKKLLNDYKHYIGIYVLNITIYYKI